MCTLRWVYLLTTQVEISSSNNNYIHLPATCINKYSAHVHHFPPSKIYPLGLVPMEVPVRIKIAVLVFGFARISKYMNSTVTKTEGVLNGIRAKYFIFI